MTDPEATPTGAPALPWWLALPFAALGGLALDAATPWLAWWPAGLTGAALVIASVWQQRAWRGLLFGVVAGACFWLPHIHWLTLYLGPIPWLALSSVMIAWFALFGLAAALATRGLASTRLRAGTLLLAQSIVVAGLWVAREQVQSSWPYGGFAWGRLAHTQAEGPLLALVSWLGFAGLSGLLAFACALVAGGFLTLRGGAVRLRSSSLIALATVATLALLSLVPPAPLEQAGAVRVAAVQGDSKSGIFDDRENGDVFRAHLEATEALLDRLESTGESVDLIVWPENSGEFQLPDETYRSLAIQRLAARAGAPIVVGTVLAEQGDDGETVYTNSSLVYSSDADGHVSVNGRYDKRRPVPFAEYMPNRTFFHALVPDLVDLVQLEYAFGRLPAAVQVETPRGEVRAGIAICFDIVFDDHAVAMMSENAELILAQTNNADFGRTDESAQQLQIARLRAVETGRALVNISTVGTSAIVMPDGTAAAMLAPFTADAMVAEVPLVRGQTPALRFGAAIAGAWIVLGLAGVGAGVLTLARRRRRDR